MIIEPVQHLAGTVRVPGDKSVTHRAFILGAIAEGEQTVRGFPDAADVTTTLACLQTLGARERTDLPLYLGFGISSAAQASSACESADGVIIGSALMKMARSAEPGKAPEKIEAFLREVRSAIDKAADSATAIENTERTE